VTVPAIAVTQPRGKAGAPLIVLGTSLGTSSILWDAAAARLRDDFRVLSWDLPGHGSSPVAREPFTVAELASAVLAAVDGLGEDRFHYAGVSLGGATGLELLLAAPHRVIAAAVICSGAMLGTPESWAERAATVRSQGTASIVVASAGRWFAPGSIERQPDIAGRLLHSLRDADDESYALCAEALAGYDVRDRLHEIAVPVLAIWGDHDAVAPEPTATAVADGVENGRLQRIADAGHLAPAEQPEAVASALIDFFEGAA
jgi:3-oxoadipate enol-lactonase